MMLRFWGVRGSLPSPVTSAQVRKKIRAALLGAASVDLNDAGAVDAYVDSLPLHIGGTLGGNTPCVELRTSNGELVIFDCGTGLRPLGNKLMQGEFGQGKGEAWIVVGHTHWDHVQGFPFFVPAYVPGNRLHICCGFPDIEERFRGQFDPRYFPVRFEDLGADIDFHHLENWTELADGRLRLRTFEMDHPGKCYGTRLEAEERVVVYASDAEYKRLDHEVMSHFADIYRDADVLIFDAMFELRESWEKRDWGHSSAVVGVELAVEANVRRLVLFHHDPASEDDRVVELMDRAAQYHELIPSDHQCEIIVAHEGLEIEV